MKEYYKAYSKWLANKPAIEVTGKNPHYKNEYKELDVVIATVKQPLLDCGLVFGQWIEANNVITELFHLDSGESKLAAIPLNPDLKAHEIGSQITYFRRYGLLTMLGYTTGADDDGNAASGLDSKPEKAAPKAPDKPEPSQAERDKLKADLAKATVVAEARKISADFQAKYKLTPVYVDALDSLVAKEVQRIEGVANASN